MSTVRGQLILIYHRLHSEEKIVMKFTSPLKYMSTILYSPECVKSGKIQHNMHDMSCHPLNKHGPGWWCCSLQWRHKEHDGVSNHRRLDCWLSRCFRRRPKKTSKLRVTERRWPVDSPHRRPVTLKMLPFDDVIMLAKIKSNQPVMNYYRSLYIIFMA